MTRLHDDNPTYAGRVGMTEDQEREYRDGMGSVTLGAAGYHLHKGVATEEVPPEPAPASHANAVSETEWRKTMLGDDPREEVVGAGIEMHEPVETRTCAGPNCHALMGTNDHSPECFAEHSKKCQDAADADDGRKDKPPVEPNNDEVICPNCAHQFRAIPVNIQNALSMAGYEPPYMAPYEGAQSVMVGGIWSVPTAVAQELEKRMLQGINQQDLGARVYATVAAALRQSWDLEPGQAVEAHQLQKLQALMLTALRDIKSVFPAIAHGDGEGQDLTPGVFREPLGSTGVQQKS